MAEKRDRRGLGRGLSALMADVNVEAATPSQVEGRKGFETVPIERIYANPDQPRRQFTENDLTDLTNSVREKGVIQPLIVRPLPGDPTSYQIVAGERRWRAAQAVGLTTLKGHLVAEEKDQAEKIYGQIANNTSEPLTPWDIACTCKQLKEELEKTIKSIESKLALESKKANARSGGQLASGMDKIKEEEDWDTKKNIYD